ncbi:MAG: AAA family ATPase [Acidobacteria bacterium]|nr:AAA family ATPase [Acidobacteriota bacterium]MDW7984138.1 AAA family ATPase [Acidobacteriota bacterium]
MTWRWRIKGFRNLDVDVELDEGLTLVVGPNASGKTSLLEALYWVAYGRSFRTRSAAAVLRHGHPSAGVQIERLPSLEKIELQLTASASKLRYQGQLISFAEWRKRWPLLYIGGREWAPLSSRSLWRRKLLDESLLSLFPEYQEWRRRYRQAWIQRTHALMAGWSAEARHPWDGAFIQAGAKVWEARHYLIRQVREAVQSRWRRLFPQETLEIQLWSPWVPSWESQLPSVLQEALRRAETAEKSTGRCQVGPHRDDLAIRTASGSFWETASAGQVRSFLIVWAEAVAEMAEKLGKAPMLLLIDDFDAEIDLPRARLILSWLARPRVILTTHRRFWLRVEDFPGQCMEIREGRLIPVAVSGGSRTGSS